MTKHISTTAFHSWDSDHNGGRVLQPLNSPRFNTVEMIDVSMMKDVHSYEFLPYSITHLNFSSLPLCSPYWTDYQT